MRELRIACYVNQAGSTQISEVARHGWLWEGEDVDDIADAQFAGGEETQDSDSCGIGESFENCIEIVDGGCVNF